MSLLDKAKGLAKQGAAIGKEKFEDVKFDREINKLHQEIGELVVAQRGGTAPEDADAQIDAKVAKVAELEQAKKDNDAKAPEGEQPAAEAAPGGEAAS